MSEDSPAYTVKPSPEEWEAKRQHIRDLLAGFDRLPSKDGTKHWRLAPEQRFDELRHAISDILEWTA